MDIPYIISVVKAMIDEIGLEYLLITHMEYLIAHECFDESERSYYRGRIDEKRVNIKFLELTVDALRLKN